MDGDWYVVETMIRSRLAEAQARARFAALRGEPNERSPQANTIASWCIDLGRSLVNGLWKELAKSRVRCRVGRQPHAVHSDAPPDSRWRVS